MDTRHRQVKYLNNIRPEVRPREAQIVIRPVRGFNTVKTAYATINGFEMMRAFR